MKNPTRTEAIKAFLNAKAHRDLANRYSRSLECQVNVAQDGGQKIDGEFKGRQWHGFTDGSQTWKSFRIPFNAATDPTYEDSEMNFDLIAHVEGIGMTGWNWEKRQSEWVAFDFDSITGHKEAHARKMNEADLDAVKKAAFDIPWVTVRKSAGGKGLHLYVFIKPVDTDNHTEHAALARAILGKMSALTGFDFSTKVDICGGNMWVWHRKAAGNDGLALVKEGGILDEPPDNWKDHIKVIKGSRKKILPSFFENTDQNNLTEEEQFFLELTGQNVKVPLNEEHKKVIKWLEENKTRTWWDSDHWMLVTHTFHLAQCHEELGLRGIFKTIAKGTEAGHDHNCLGGDAEILTDKGIFPIKDLSKIGKATLYVKTNYGMQWIESEIRSFGLQETYPVHFSNDSTVRATNEHLWLWSSRNKICEDWQKIPTSSLTSRIYLPLAPQELPEIDWEGYAHGFVFGDGWKVKNKWCDVALFKHDRDLQNLFEKYGNVGIQAYNGKYVPTVRRLPVGWKELPDRDCSKSYALGFVLGLISADGIVSHCVEIFQSNFSVLEEVRKLSAYCGLRVRNIRLHGKGSYKNTLQGYALTIETYNLTKDHFLRKDHKEKLNVKKKCFTTTARIFPEHKKIEEVFCAIVPEHHNFTLANGVITGNCYLFPTRDGGWTARRYSIGVAEAETWDQDGRGWTRCNFNREPDLQTSARAHQGIEDPSGGFQFTMAEMAETTARSLGAQFTLPNVLRMRKAKLKEHKDGRLLVEVEGEPTDNIGTEMKGWLNKKGTWTRLFNIKIQNMNEIETASYDELIRHLITESGEDYGWVIRGDVESWRSEPLVHVRTAMKSMNIGPKEVEQILGAAVMRCWTLVNRPFQPEYPGDRTWNRDAAQFRFAPSPNPEQLNYPTWMKILRHCGSGLDDAVLNHPWCKTNGILNGADYLKVWIASLFQEPTQPLPYLFFYSKDQNTGKSIFHEALNLLITSGYVLADKALVSQGGFSGELKNAIICVVEEIDLRKHKDAYNRIKDWVTALQISIHIKGETPYHIKNTTHWIQTANDPNACPVFPGDTRITMSYVRPLDPLEMIPKKRLIPMLEKEAADFLAEILSLEIPSTNSRLNVEVITTTEKIELEGINETLLDQFIKEKMIYAPGYKIKFSDLYDHFCNFITPDDINYWTKKRFAMDLSQLRQHPKGRFSQDGQIYIGNITFLTELENIKLEKPLPKLGTKTDDQKVTWLIPEGGSNGNHS